MSLIKKTLVLTDRTPKGYVTFVRVGGESGAKIVGESFAEGMQAYIKIGHKTQILTLCGKRTECELEIPLENTEYLSCVVFSEGKRVASGGKDVPEKELSDAINFKEKEESPVVPDEDNSADEEEMLRRLSEGKSGYYIGIRDKIDELFVVYPNERELEGKIPDSEWVKVRYDGDDYYVVGKLKEDGKVKYLGYGVPGREDIKPPKITDGIANWFPVENIPGADGYWLFFQDAETGRIS